jgi:protein-tyrosine phosphatase
LFFRSKTPAIESYASLGVDLHSHLIPGIDDGAKTLEESLALIRRMVELGFKRIYTTPHVMADHYPNTREGILRGLEGVLRGLDGIPIELGVAAEYFLDEQFEELLQKEELLTLPGKRVLVEMAGVAPAHKLLDTLFRMRTKGYKPLLAHPERYPYYRRDFKALERLKDFGCEFQVNLLSLAGHYGSTIQEQGFKLIKHGMVEFLATDMHSEQHADKLKEALGDKRIQKVLEKKFSNGSL